MNVFLISQILIGIALVTDFTSFQFKDRKKIVLLLCISAALVSSHYFLLEKNTAGVLVLVSLIRFITSYFSTRKIFMFLFVGLNILGFSLTYTSPLSFLILMGLILATIGSFQKTDKSLRIFLFVGVSLILSYDILIFSPMAMVLDISFLVSNIMGFYRFYIRKKLPAA